jgi:hypothetical protein
MLMMSFKVAFPVLDSLSMLGHDGLDLDGYLYGSWPSSTNGLI